MIWVIVDSRKMHLPCLIPVKDPNLPKKWNETAVTCVWLEFFPSRHFVETEFPLLGIKKVDTCPSMLFRGDLIGGDKDYMRLSKWSPIIRLGDYIKRGRRQSSQHTHALSLHLAM